MRKINQSEENSFSSQSSEMKMIFSLEGVLCVFCCPHQNSTWFIDNSLYSTYAIITQTDNSFVVLDTKTNIDVIAQ